MDLVLRRGKGAYLGVIWPDGETSDGPSYLYAKAQGWVPTLRSGQKITFKLGAR